MGRTERVLVEGLTMDQLLSLPATELDGLLLAKPEIVFSIGSADVLAGVRISGSRLIVVVGHIDGGGEGVLPTLWGFSARYAEKRGLAEIEWLVHAVNCPRPNLRLRRVLEKRGFVVEDVPGAGRVYRLVQKVRSGHRDEDP